MKHKLMLAVMTLLLTLGMASTAARADSVTFTLNNANQTINNGTGGTLTFNATTSAPASNGAPVFLNGDSFNVTSPLNVDDTDFFVNFPFFLNPADSFTGDLFSIHFNPGVPSGIYVGTFTLLGGADGVASDPLGTVNFSINVTPEPSSILLFGTGLTGLVGVIRRRRQA